MLRALRSSAASWAGGSRRFSQVAAGSSARRTAGRMGSRDGARCRHAAPRLSRAALARPFARQQQPRLPSQPRDSRSRDAGARASCAAALLPAARRWPGSSPTTRRSQRRPSPRASRQRSKIRLAGRGALPRGAAHLPERPGLGIDPDAEVEDEQRRARQRRFRLRLAALVEDVITASATVPPAASGCGSDDYEHACAGSSAPIILGAWRGPRGFGRSSRPGPTSC